MKFFLIIFLILSYPCLGQYPRKANVAVIETDSLKASRIFRVCIEILESKGYRLNRLDYSSFTLMTEPVVIHELPLLFKIEIEVNDALASIRGYVLDDRDFADLGLYPVPKEWEDAAYRSFSGSTWRTGFEVVVEMVEKIRSAVNGKVLWNRW